MSNEWDAYAEGWDVDASVKAYADKAFMQLSRTVDLDGLTVLDFGCGTGTLSQRLSPQVNRIVALDGSPAMINMLATKQLANVATIADFLTQELIDNHPLLRNPFDLIVASSVCGFLPNYEMTLGLLHSLLKSGGRFVQWDWLADDDASGTGLTEQRVLGALQQRAFVEIQLTQPFEMPSSRGTRNVLMAVASKA